MPSHSRYLQPGLQNVTWREHLATMLAGWTRSMNSFQPLGAVQAAGPRRSTQALPELRKPWAEQAVRPHVPGPSGRGTPPDSALPAGSRRGQPSGTASGEPQPRGLERIQEAARREISWPQQIRVRGGDYGAGLCPEIMTRRVHPHTDRNADLNRSPRSSFPWLSLGSHTRAPKPTLPARQREGRACGSPEATQGPFWGHSLPGLTLLGTCIQQKPPHLPCPARGTRRLPPIPSPSQDLQPLEIGGRWLFVPLESVRPPAVSPHPQLLGCPRSLPAP